MTKDEIIKQRYPFYNPDIAQKDIEISSEDAKELMEAYFIDQLKIMVKELQEGYPEHIISRINDKISYLETRI